jgi:hypothetical protein
MGQITWICGVRRDECGASASGDFATQTRTEQAALCTNPRNRTRCARHKCDCLVSLRGWLGFACLQRWRPRWWPPRPTCCCSHARSSRTGHPSWSSSAGRWGPLRLRHATEAPGGHKPAVLPTNPRPTLPPPPPSSLPHVPPMPQLPYPGACLCSTDVHAPCFVPAMTGDNVTTATFCIGAGFDGR